MSSALKVKDYVPDVAAAPAAVAARISAIQELGRDIRGEGAIHDLERDVAALRRGTKRLVAEARQRKAENLDALIDNLLIEERRADAESRPQIAAAKRGLRLLKRAPGSYRKAVEPLMSRMIELLQVQKEILRDARWQLMVIRADSVPESRGRVFEDAKSLRQYLSTSRR